MNDIYKICFQITKEQHEKVQKLPREFNLSTVMRTKLDEVLNEVTI